MTVRRLVRTAVYGAVAALLALAACDDTDGTEVADDTGLADAVGETGDTAASDTDDQSDADAVDVDAADVDAADADLPDDDSDAGDAEWDLGPPPEPYAPEYCAYFLTGEVDLRGTDYDGDGVPNGWDHCPNNAFDWLDSDRDGIGNKSDPDMDGDDVPNDEDDDRDGDGATDVDEAAAGTDPGDPSSIPGLPRFEADLGVFDPRPGWYLGDLHLHTEASHDTSAPLDTYFEPWAEAGLDFQWVTDHRVFEAPFDPAWDQDEILLIPGIEWGGGGHAGMGGVRTGNTANYDSADDIRRSWRLAWLQGAVQSINHYGADTDYWDRIFEDAPDLVAGLDVMEVWNVWWTLGFETNEPSVAQWEAWLDEGYRIGAVGGSDVHGPGLTVAFPTTVVWADSLSVPGILDGVRRGRTYVTQSFPYFAPGFVYLYDGRPMLEFRVDADRDGEFEAMLGDSVAAGTIELSVAVTNAHGPVVLIKDGLEVARWDDHEPGSDIADTVIDEAGSGSWYRVQMRETGEADSPMLLLSSPIYVGGE